MVAIVGRSGAGKTTLVNLIPRFFDVSAGGIYIDGRDIRDVTLKSLRAQVGIVTQETVLVRRYDCEQHRVRRDDGDAGGDRSGGAGGARPRVHRRPRRDGYHTRIGERGTEAVRAGNASGWPSRGRC